MFKHFLLTSFRLALLCLLAGCTSTFIPPTHIQDLAANYPMAIAVDPQGTKYLAGVDPSTYHLTYFKTKLGEITDKGSIPPQPGRRIFALDIDVMDDGTAIIAWIEDSVATPKTYSICYYLYPAPFDPDCYMNASAGDVYPVVQVVARGSTAYLIYSKKEITQYNLYYVRLTGGIVEGKVNWTTTDPHVKTVSSAIDSEGYLHVVWYAQPGSGDGRVLYASNRSTNSSGDMTQNRILLIGNSSIDYPPAIAVYSEAGQERIALAYVRRRSGSDDEIYHQNIKVDNTSWSGEQKLNLTGGAYRLTDVHAVPGISGYLIGFLRKTTDSATYEVWLRDVSGSIRQITNNSQDEEELQMVAVNGIFVMGYKRIPSESQPNQVWIYDPIAGERLVYSESCSSINLGADMASNGDFAAGVWAQCDKTWFSTNAELIHLPVVLK